MIIGSILKICSTPSSLLTTLLLGPRSLKHFVVATSSYTHFPMPKTNLEKCEKI